MKCPSERYVEHVVLGLVVQVAAEVLAHRELHQNHVEEVLEALRRVLEARDRPHDRIGQRTQRVAHLFELFEREGGVGQSHLENQDHVIDHEFVARVGKREKSGTRSCP